MQTTPQTPLTLTPGSILRSGRETITIVSAHVTAGRPEVSYLADDKLWAFPRRSVERVLAAMGFAPSGQEDPAVLAERVLLAEAGGSMTGAELRAASDFEREAARVMFLARREAGL